MKAASRISIFGLIFWLLLVFIAAAIGSAGAMGAPDVYTQLVRPAWAPPPWVFGPVWTLIYAFMAVAAWLVWRARGVAGAWPALLLFLVQLAVNALWTWLFFNWQLGALAFADIVLLWALLLAVTIAFWRVKPMAGVLMAAYLLWVSYAAILNYAVWQLNTRVLG